MLKKWDTINYKRGMYILQRNKDNRSTSKLSNSSCDALERICDLRHKMHVLDPLDLFNTECSQFDTVKDAISKILELMEDNKEIDIHQDILGGIDDKLNKYLDSDFYILDEEDIIEATSLEENDLKGLDEEERREEIQEAYRIVASDYYSDLLSEINAQLEHYLVDIDELYNTNYCPTGHQRLL